MEAPGDATGQLPVPVTVRIACKAIRMEEMAQLGTGSIIKLPRQANEDLDVMINAAVIAKGRAVKIGENFGVEITSYRGLDGG